MTIRTAKFKLGGVDRTVNVPISLALTIEEATGVGVLDLVRSMLTQQAKLGTVATVLRVALNESKQMLSHDDVMAGIEKDGFYAAYLSAATVLNAFFAVPEGDKAGTSKKAKAPVLISP